MISRQKEHWLAWCGKILRTVLLLSLSGPGLAQQASYEDGEVKAAFLARFPQFVEWPQEAFQTPDSALVIGVTGADGVSGALVKMLAAKPRSGRPVVTHQVKSPDDVTHIHMLFVGSESKNRIERYIAAAEGRPVLIVTDFIDALDRGSMINFITVERRVRFEISLENAERVKLGMSSRLLSLATRIRRGAVFGSEPVARLEPVEQGPKCLVRTDPWRRVNGLACEASRDRHGYVGACNALPVELCDLPVYSRRARSMRTASCAHRSYAAHPGARFPPVG